MLDLFLTAYDPSDLYGGSVGPKARGTELGVTLVSLLPQMVKDLRVHLEVWRDHQIGNLPIGQDTVART